MIYGIFHRGSGVGNQLHRYIATRVMAEERCYGKFSMINPRGCKVLDFMDIDLGEPNDIEFHVEEPAGKVVPHSNLPFWEEKRINENGIDVRSYDPEFNFQKDNVIIDGEFQDDKYWRGYDISKWLKTEPLEMPDDLCPIGFRGGEFLAFPELFLTSDYWIESIGMMKARGVKHFEVHTDDPETAKKVFPDFPVIHDVGRNWRAFRYAKQSIISNSSFYILPSLLNERSILTIAPRYWARRNIGIWASPANYYPKLYYV